MNALTVWFLRRLKQFTIRRLIEAVFLNIRGIMEKLKEEIIAIAVPILTALVSMLLTKIYDFIKGKLEAKFIVKIEKIASTVEQTGKGLLADEKLALFCDICKSMGLNVVKAVEYLEARIIPITNQINVFKSSTAKEDVKDDVNGVY